MNKSDEVSRKPLKKILLDNFLGGIAWGLGITLGAGIILALGGFILSKINLIPVIGSFVLNIVEFVEQNNPQL